MVEDLKAEAAAEELKKKKEKHYRGEEEEANAPEEEKKDEGMREAEDEQEAPQEVVEVLEESFFYEGVEYTAKKSSLKELQALCREHGVKTTGSKKQLLKRLATAVRKALYCRCIHLEFGESPQGHRGALDTWKRRRG